ncbi:hypothetical protein [Streptomyces broussonetiae]|uniref:TPM domain-containing protein n=1 Tax=Streptomyces broussonetiae TaxID=2686304 RepID=A0A6I6NED3_9ACTN|nr:hypothetical protein [Streptomyces broussonetiae]QHA06616.1 hypothetical protein GQF42_28015 [Streptomyces broussonetiae]
MTSSLIRGRPRRAKAHIRIRVAHAVLGAVAGFGWLVLPVMTVGAQDPVPLADTGTVAGAAAPQQGGTSAVDLVLPLVVGVAAVVLAGYGYLRRTRRARTRTTPGIVSAVPPAPAPAALERQARKALVLADDCVRTSREELSFVQERFAWQDTEEFTHALRSAQTELAAACAIWRRYEQGVPEEAAARRQALVGVIGRCAEAGRRLDTGAAALDLLRGLEGPGLDRALEVAEGRFRQLAGRTVTAQETFAALHERYAPSALDPVTGYVEQAKDRLVFATARLNDARQAADRGDGDRAAGLLRAAEGAVAQAGVLISGVERLATELAEAAGLLPATLTGAEAELAAARQERGRKPLTSGELHARLTHADTVLAVVRDELISGPYDPLDALHRIVRAVQRLEDGRAGVVAAAALLVARGSVAGADGFITVHRGVVGPQARVRLAQAVGELAAGHTDRADTAAREARDLSERDVRTHGTPYPAATQVVPGLAGAVQGGVLLAEDDNGDPPASYGGPETRGRRRTGPA